MRSVVLQMGISIDGYASGRTAARRLEVAEVTPYPDGTVISIYRRPR